MIRIQSQNIEEAKFVDNSSINFMKISDTHDVNMILEHTPEHHDFLM